ncbi:MAG: hypothetical protein U9R36_06515 [Elusimicrobiota bacterium]|nr:hypothetical protein [Elusimicrobiota bacterium]
MDNTVKVNVAKSFKEAREWDDNYENSLSPAQRHENSLYLKKIYCIRKNIKFNDIKPAAKIIDLKTGNE